jgi:hypothetical protein
MCVSPFMKLPASLSTCTFQQPLQLVLWCSHVATQWALSIFCAVCKEVSRAFLQFVSHPEQERQQTKMFAGRRWQLWQWHS